MKKLVTALIALCACVSPIAAQSVSGRFVTSVYGWDRQDTVGQSTQHMRGYENVQLNAAYGDFSFATYLLGSTDFSNQMENDPGLRLFNLMLQWKNIGGMADLKVGRMPVYGGVNYGTIDGALVRVRPTDGVEVSGYAGGLTPPSQRTDFFHNLDQNWQAGAQALFYLVADTKIGLSYMNRHRETSPFTALRPDAQLTLVPTTVDYGSRANQYGSVDAAWEKGDWWAFGRLDYDFNFERLSRAELAATWQAMPTLGFSLNVAHREPTIAYNSYFSLLEAEANQEAVIGVDWQLLPRLTVLGRFSAVVYEEDKAYRASIGVANKYASVMYTKDISYDGDLDGFNLQLTYPLLHGTVIPHVGAVYSSYALADNLDKTSAWAGILGATVRPWHMLSFDLQGQYMANRIYKSDMRVFARINYWFSHTFGLAD